EAAAERSPNGHDSARRRSARCGTCWIGLARLLAPPREVAPDTDEHAHHLFGEVLVRCSRVVVEDVLLGDEGGEVVEQRRLVVLDEQVVRVVVVVEDDSLLLVPASSDPVEPQPEGVGERRAPSPGVSPVGDRMGLSRSASSLSTRPNTLRKVSASRSAVCSSTSRATFVTASATIGSMLRTASRNTGNVSRSRRTARRPADCCRDSKMICPLTWFEVQGAALNSSSSARSSMIVVPARPTIATRLVRSSGGAT